MANATTQPAHLTLENGHRDNVHYLPTMVSAGDDGEGELMVPAKRDVLGALMEQHEVIRDHTQRQLEEIDEQMRTLPGPSMAGWAMANAQSCAA